jgi:hypothetical protein
MRSLLTGAAVLVLLALGVAGMVLGEADDSPGLQGLGLLLILGGVVLAVRAARRGRTQASSGR